MGGFVPTTFQKTIQGHKMERMQWGITDIHIVFPMYLFHRILEVITHYFTVQNQIMGRMFVLQLLQSHHRCVQSYETAYHFLENCSTLPSVLTIVITLTPSSLTSNIFLPNTFFSCFAGIMCKLRQGME